MKKAKLKHASGQYVLIKTKDTKELGTPPILGNWYLTLQHGINKTKTWDLRQYTKENPLLKANLVSGVYQVIAADNLDGVKGIRFNIKDPVNNDYLNAMGFDKLFESLIDTEVEVTEDGEYWIVRL